MDARLFRAAVLLAAAGSLGASYRTENFLITAPTEELAQQIGHEAERFRRELALEWLGRELPRWSQPCPITATVGDELGAGGVTRFYFDRGPSGRVEPLGWQMAVQGSRERILDSVLPHEVMHTVFASHFRRPLPRWADEGACTVVEHASERAKQHQMLITFLKTGRGIPFDKMFAMKEYPPDMLPIYSQGYSATRFLIAHGGKRKFVQFMETGFRLNDWPAAVRQHYGYQDLGALQNTWLDWVRAGSPNQVDPSQEKETLLVDGSGRRARPEPNLIYREPRGIEDASAAAAVPIAPRGGSTSPHAAPAG
jgi:hypothetical protein